ncbi:hypothetical protein MCACPph1_CDS0010 [Moorella phage MCACPph1]
MKIRDYILDAISIITLLASTYIFFYIIAPN